MATARLEPYPTPHPRPRSPAPRGDLWGPCFTLKNVKNYYKKNTIFLFYLNFSTIINLRINSKFKT